MQIHQIQRKTKLKKTASVGRGGKRGKTSGRGTKGQKARSGHKLRPELRDIIKRLPKRRGYGKNRNLGKEKIVSVVNIKQIEARFKTGGSITLETLFEKGLIKKTGGVFPKVKILGDGDIRQKIEVMGMNVSSQAREKIEKAGGSVK